MLQRFHRGSAGRRGPKGSGLGLPIATELAREWGARVELVNREGGGARAVLSWDERGERGVRRLPLAAWLTAAALGLVLAGGAGVGVSKLVDQEVGLSDEPITAGEQLAPSSTSTTAPPTTAPPPGGRAPAGPRRAGPSTGPPPRRGPPQGRGHAHHAGAGAAARSSPPPAAGPAERGRRRRGRRAARRRQQRLGGGGGDDSSGKGRGRGRGGDDGPDDD